MGNEVSWLKYFVILIVGLSGSVGLSVHASELLETDAAKVDTWSVVEPDFLPVDEAFILSAEVAQDGAVLVNWAIEDGYYLYRHRFNFTSRLY